jgi:hypothetical protein
VRGEACGLKMEEVPASPLSRFPSTSRGRFNEGPLEVHLPRLSIADMISHFLPATRHLHGA